MSAPMLSGPWQRRDGARPLRAWRGEQLETIAGAFGSVLQKWEADWGLRAPDGLPACAPATDADVADASWHCIGANADQRAWWELRPDWAEVLAGSMWRADASSRIAQTLAHASRDDLALRLRSSLSLPAQDQLQPSTLPVLHAWSGTVVVRTGWGIRVLLEAPVVESLLGASGSTAARPQDRSPARVSVAQAMAQRSVALHVQLAACELSFGALQDLRPGDVVRIPHALDTPAVITDRAGAPVFGGFLARRADRLAVELAPMGMPY